MDFPTRIRDAFAAAGVSVAADVLEELAQHAESTYAEQEARGESASAALAAADELIAGWLREAKHLRLTLAVRLLRVHPPPLPAARRALSRTSVMASGCSVESRKPARSPS
jgi:hypothetical protein